MEKKEEDYLKIIESLRSEIKSKDHDIYLAATFGKQLLDEKENLNKKVEEAFLLKETLQQEKYSLQNTLESKSQLLNAHISEIESCRKDVDELQKYIKVLKKENEVQVLRVRNTEKDKGDLEKIQEDIQLENESLKKKILVLEQQIGSFQHFNEVSMIEIGQEEILQAELSQCISKIKELEDYVSKLQFELESSKLQSTRTASLVKNLEEKIDFQNEKISALIVENKKEKDLHFELQCEIDKLKMEQVDVKRRGNSVFGELDDRRLLVEREYKTLKTNYVNIKHNYDEIKNELTRCKSQMVILLSMRSRSHQDKYIEKLEQSLTEKKNEIQELTIKLNKTMRSQQTIVTKAESQKTGEYSYLRVLHAQAEDKIKKLENELMTLHMQYMEQDDKIIENRRFLYETQEESDFLKAENVKLRLKLHDLTFKPESEKTRKSESNIETSGFRQPLKPLDAENVGERENASKNAYSVDCTPPNAKLDQFKHARNEAKNSCSSSDPKLLSSTKKEEGCAQQ